MLDDQVYGITDRRTGMHFAGWHNGKPRWTPDADKAWSHDKSAAESQAILLQNYSNPRGGKNV